MKISVGSVVPSNRTEEPCAYLPEPLFHPYDPPMQFSKSVINAAEPPVSFSTHRVRKPEAPRSSILDMATYRNSVSHERVVYATEHASRSAKTIADFNKHSTRRACRKTGGNTAKLATTGSGSDSPRIKIEQPIVTIIDPSPLNWPSLHHLPPPCAGEGGEIFTGYKRVGPLPETATVDLGGEARGLCMQNINVTELRSESARNALQGH